MVSRAGFLVDNSIYTKRFDLYVGVRHRASPIEAADQILT
jgi:hypothetical protein